MLDLVLSILGTILYPLFAVVFVLLDVLQNIFQAFAGTGTIYYNGAPGNEITADNTGLLGDTGIIYYLFQSDVVKNLLFSIATLALFLIIVFTVMAFIKNVYTTKPKKWQDIVISAIKGLASFIFIPVCCLLGVWLGNILLNAIDGATSSSGTNIMSRKLFITAAYNANWVRKCDDTLEVSSDVIQLLRAYSGDNSIEYGMEITPDQKSYYAALLDFAFTNLNLDKNRTYTVTYQDASGETKENTVKYVGSNSQGIFSIYGLTVSNYYQLWDINYLTLIIGGCFMCYAMITLAYAMVRRMFVLLVYFVISPALCAMYPLDDGSAVGTWKKKFIGETISAYGAVAGLNIFFSLIPLIENISLLPTAGNKMTWIPLYGDAIYIVQLFILVTGLFVVKELIGTISGLIGAEDAYSKGASLRTSTKKAIKDHGKKVTTSAFTIGRAFRYDKKSNTGGFGRGFATIGNELLKNTTGLDVLGGIDQAKTAKKGERFTKATSTMFKDDLLGFGEGVETADKITTDRRKLYEESAIKRTANLNKEEAKKSLTWSDSSNNNSRLATDLHKISERLKGDFGERKGTKAELRQIAEAEEYLQFAGLDENEIQRFLQDRLGMTRDTRDTDYRRLMSRVHNQTQEDDRIRNAAIPQAVVLQNNTATPYGAVTEVSINQQSLDKLVRDLKTSESLVGSRLHNGEADEIIGRISNGDIDESLLNRVNEAMHDFTKFTGIGRSDYNMQQLENMDQGRMRQQLEEALETLKDSFARVADEFSTQDYEKMSKNIEKFTKDLQDSSKRIEDLTDSFEKMQKDIKDKRNF